MPLVINVSIECQILHKYNLFFGRSMISKFDTNSSLKDYVNENCLFVVVRVSVTMRSGSSYHQTKGGETHWWGLKIVITL